MKKRTKTLLIIIFFIAISTTAIFISRQARNTSLAITGNVSKFFWQSGANTKNFFSNVFNIKGIAQENENLKQENLNLSSKIIELENLKQENQTLKAALNIQKNNNWQFETADIISKEQNKEVLTINKGSKDGLAKNMVAITQNGALLGKLTDVFDNFSKLTLITSLDFSFNIEVAAAENPGGVARGEGGLLLGFDYIPKEIEIKEGDIAQTSALEEIFPKGVLVGKIKSIEKNEAEPYQKGIISPSFSIEPLKTVLIIK